VGHPIPEATAAGPPVVSPAQPPRHRGKATCALSPDVSVDTEDNNDEGTDVEAYLN
jgi:hypothetical protein